MSSHTDNLLWKKDDAQRLPMKAWNERWKSEKGRALWLEPASFIASLVPRFKEEGVKKVLDVGFGVGRHAILFAKEGFDVYGIDTSESGLEYARKWAKKEKLTVHLQTSEMSSLPFKRSFFDLIVAWNVLYHGTLDSIRNSVEEIRRCLKQKGYLLCSLISVKNDKYGLGEEIEKDTFTIPEEKEKSHPHHYFDRNEVRQCLIGFSLSTCKDVEQFRCGDFHWHILAKLISKERA